MVYADYGSNASNPTNSLWIPLAEKAYAQWNETGKEGRDGTNTYAGIEGGWMATVDAQVLGHNATDYSLTTSTEQAMINALAANEAVTIGTDGSNNSADTLPDGLYGSHAYAVIGYNASTGLFTLIQPLGFRPARRFELEPTRGDVRRVRRGQYHGFGADQRRQPTCPRGRGRLAHFGRRDAGVSTSPSATTNADSTAADYEYMVPAGRNRLAAGPAATGDSPAGSRRSMPCWPKQDFGSFFAVRRSDRIGNFGRCYFTIARISSSLRINSSCPLISTSAPAQR